MVITIEPGIYVPPDSSFPKEFHNIGIRIEVREFWLLSADYSCLESFFRTKCSSRAIMQWSLVSTLRKRCDFFCWSQDILRLTPPLDCGRRSNLPAPCVVICILSLTIHIRPTFGISSTERGRSVEETTSTCDIYKYLFTYDWTVATVSFGVPFLFSDSIRFDI